MAEYIERKTTLDSICTDNCERAYEGVCNNCRIVQLIEDIPAADVAPVVHGRWDNWGGEPLWQQCSACHYRIQYSYSKDCNYCPNCGARMQGGSDE